MDKNIINLICTVYSGSFLNIVGTTNNIGHENINFFEPEFTNKKEKKWLIWFNPGGKVDNNKLKNRSEINLILIVNDFGNQKSKYRVLALFKNCHVIEAAKQSGSASKSGFQRRKKFNDEFNVDGNEVLYFGKRIQDIFSENQIDGEKINDLLATFWVKKENALFTKKEIFIKFDSNEESKENNVFLDKQNVWNIQKNLGQAMRLYLKGEEYDLKELIELIQNNSSNNPKEGILESELKELDKENVKNINESFFTALNIEKDELVVSNAIAHSLNNSFLFEAFIKCLFKKENQKEEINNIKLETRTLKYRVKREEKRVDLQIEFNNYKLIIENKIDSPIIYYDKNKTNKIFEDIKKNLKNENKKNELNDCERNVQEDNKKFSQLSKYYLINEFKEPNEKNNKTRNKYFLLVPEYNKVYFENEKNNIWFGEKYTLISYKDLFDAYDKVDNNKAKYKFIEDLKKEFELLSKNNNNLNIAKQLKLFASKARSK